MDLFLYEEIMLLALRDDKGTVSSHYAEYAIAGAVLAEVLLESRIAIDNSSKKLIELKDKTRIGDPIIDEAVALLAKSRKPVPLQTWLDQIANIKELRHKVAKQLCERGILSAEESKVLLLFTRRVYPEINPEPEKKILQRLRNAIFGSSDEIDPRTMVLISLAHSARLLEENFGHAEIKLQRERIKRIVDGEIAGNATKEVITACETVLIVTTIIPTILATTVMVNN